MNTKNGTSHTFLEVHVVIEDEILVDDMYSFYNEQGIQFGLDNQNPQGSIEGPEKLTRGGEWEPIKIH
jgi:hypothetical protein